MLFIFSGKEAGRVLENIEDDIDPAEGLNAKSKWYVAQLKPNGFQKAVVNLERQNFKTFMPLQERNAKIGRRLSIIEKPIFPGYIFVSFVPDAGGWHVINSTIGVSRLMGLKAGVPSPVPDAFMAGLFARCDNDGVLQAMSDLKVGDRVRMVSGPFADIIGEIDTILGDNNIRLLFDIMGHATKVDVASGKLERL